MLHSVPPLRREGQRLCPLRRRCLPRRWALLSSRLATPSTSPSSSLVTPNGVTRPRRSNWTVSAATDGWQRRTVITLTPSPRATRSSWGPSRPEHSPPTSIASPSASLRGPHAPVGPLITTRRMAPPARPPARTTPFTPPPSPPPSSPPTPSPFRTRPPPSASSSPSTLAISPGARRVGRHRDLHARLVHRR